ncbi:MAG: ComEC/Rec2 family competence protein, partial [Helicobacteraceae bacterium]|nr:ComEC/Rec2 family competence protein [Helicobacteraceae bacterium]
MERLALFYSYRSRALFLAVCVTLFCVNALVEYNRFLELKERKFCDINATIARQTLKTNKNGKNYWALRLESKKYGSFFTSTFEDLRSDLAGSDSSLVIITDNIGFLDFMRGFYAPSFRISIMPAFYRDSGDKLYDRAVSFVANQHENAYMRELFPAIFFASPQSVELRSAVTKYAAAHLIALSGMHLGILSLVLGAIVGFPYRMLQSRFFAWRNGFFDLGAISIVVFGCYLVFTGNVPSLLRAYAMFIFGLFLVARHIRVVSFETLFIVSIALIACYPRLLFSVGFLLSVSGVFYIFLFLRYFGDRSKIAIALGMSIYVFAAMLPIVHYYFPPTAHTQLLGPVLTIIYTPFYIVEIVLHLIGFGSLFDRFLIYAVEISVPEWNFSVPLWLCLSYIALSIAAIFHRYIHYVFIATLIVWLFWQYLLVP